MRDGGGGLRLLASLPWCRLGAFEFSTRWGGVAASLRTILSGVDGVYSKCGSLSVGCGGWGREEEWVCGFSKKC